MAFIQIIEVTTTHPEEIQELVEEWSAKNPRQAHRGSLNPRRGSRAARYLRPDRGVPVLPRSHGQLRPPGDS